MIMDKVHDIVYKSNVLSNIYFRVWFIANCVLFEYNFNYLLIISLFQSKPSPFVSSKVKESLTCLGSLKSNGFHSKLKVYKEKLCYVEVDVLQQDKEKFLQPDPST